MRASLAPRLAADQRGSLLVGALALLLLVSGFLLMAARGAITDSDAASKYRARTSAFYVSEAGLQYGLGQVGADSSWMGLSAPGRSCQEGAFFVAVSRVNEDGDSLPANQKRLVSTGNVQGATAVTSLTVQF